jgi:hypothetical protein
VESSRNFSGFSFTLPLLKNAEESMKHVLVNLPVADSSNLHLLASDLNVADDDIAPAAEDPMSSVGMLTTSFVLNIFFRVS